VSKQGREEQNIKGVSPAKRKERSSLAALEVVLPVFEGKTRRGVKKRCREGESISREGCHLRENEANAKSKLPAFKKVREIVNGPHPREEPLSERNELLARTMAPSRGDKELPTTAAKILFWGRGR